MQNNNAVAFFVACAKRVQKLSAQNKKAPYRRNGRAQKLPITKHRQQYSDEHETADTENSRVH